MTDEAPQDQPSPPPRVTSRVPAYLVVPALTLLASGVALYTLAAPRTLVAARVYGGPTTAVSQSVRVQCVRRAVGVDDLVPLDELEVDIAGVRQNARCGPDGEAEVRVTLPREGSTHVKVSRKGAPLAEGDAQVTQAEWQGGSALFRAVIPGGGTLPVRASVDGGAVVLGHWSTVRLKVADELRAPGALRITASGAELREPRRASGGLDVDLLATFVTATLTVEQPGEGPGAPPKATWEATVPVVAGALAVDSIRKQPGSVEGTVRAPQVRQRAYVRVQDRLGRRAAATLALKPDGQGGSFAPFRLEHDALSSPAFLVVSSEPSSRPQTSIAWPLDQADEPQDGRVTPDRLWLDGLSPMHEKERDRSGRMLLATGLLIATGGLLEALLLYGRSRASKRELREHLARFSDDPALSAERIEETGAGFRAAVTIATVLFGFALIAVMLLARMG